MASKPLSTTGGWVEYNGSGCPLPKGTLVDVRHFNGEVTTRVKVGEMLFDKDGTPIPSGNRPYSGWDYNDGGPIAPKFKAYRRSVDARNSAMFADWLNVSEDSLSAEEIEDLEEARGHVTSLIACRDACAIGSRARAVQNIMLRWWTKRLNELTGGAHVPDAEALTA